MLGPEGIESPVRHLSAVALRVGLFDDHCPEQTGGLRTAKAFAARSCCSAGQKIRHFPVNAVEAGCALAGVCGCEAPSHIVKLCITFAFDGHQLLYGEGVGIAPPQMRDQSVPSLDDHTVNAA